MPYSPSCCFQMDIECGIVIGWWNACLNECALNPVGPIYITGRLACSNNLISNLSSPTDDPLFNKNNKGNVSQQFDVVWAMLLRSCHSISIWCLVATFVFQLFRTRTCTRTHTHAMFTDFHCSAIHKHLCVCHRSHCVAALQAVGVMGQMSAEWTIVWEANKHITVWS